MAAVLENFTFRNRGYPWDIWLGGDILKAVQGIDFDCKVRSFQSALYERAKLEGMDVETQVDGDSVVFQFIW